MITFIENTNTLCMIRNGTEPFKQAEVRKVDISMVEYEVGGVWVYFSNDRNPEFIPIENVNKWVINGVDYFIYTEEDLYNKFVAIIE